ncbi:MAG: hypothetical protein K8I82_12195, partial [Anaerolineae bacterium]|nr:hypothetical protein [Anaerolineae bacterium]
MTIAIIVFPQEQLPPLVIHISGIIFMLTSGLVALLISHQLTKNKPPIHRILVRSLSFISVLSYYPLAYWSLMGMETGLWTVFLLLGIYALLKYVECQRRFFGILLAISLGVAYLARPETLVLSVILYCYQFIEIRKSHSTLNSLIETGRFFAFFTLFPV